MNRSPQPRAHRVAAGRAVAVVLVLLVAALAPAVSRASALAYPTPKAFVSQLDLECFKTEAYVPPVGPILTRHLNPVLTGLPAEEVTLGAREQVCVPVAKNGKIPPPGVIDFVQYVDLSCYRVQGITVNRQLQLSHLNPVLSGLPSTSVVITSPRQLCVPVVKNGKYPPPEVLRLVQYIDLKCYAIAQPTPINTPLRLTHLNPLLTGLPDVQTTATYGRQLCVPVQKNNEPIPDDVLQIVRWLDLVKYDLVAPTQPTIPLTLEHINPTLARLPREQATLTSPAQLAVPVAKNGAIPPG
ncbi:hypothetical protein [Thermomonospora umbrina]|uniref:Uncharacterized protein n=1 Tax=Thermomonospora umbrina TaxID=111806 RepID=A0A3D9SZF4_9ACTN|nr:hypothetical protein [Thermomonospora umbrina]REE97001.1 hypothetical protein DFJ69_2456 [Thermomonospora umbrina]